MTDLGERPLLLLPKRVQRYYRGGWMIDRLQGVADPSDDSGSEEWVASTTRVRARKSHESDEAPPSSNGAAASYDNPGYTGLLLPDGSATTLAEALQHAPEALLGAAHVQRHGPAMGLLVKMLDMGDPIPVHVHPPAEFAQKYLNSQHGKTEAWVVLGTRPAALEPPSVWLGFQHDTDPAEFRSWVDTQNTKAMYAALRRLAVAKDDVLFVPAGLPHALGTGLFVLEPQEPTDYSITVEYERYNLDPAKMSFGLGWDTALSCIDYQGYAKDDLLDRVRCVPQPILTEPGGSVVNLLRLESKPFFNAQRIVVTGRLQPPPAGGFAIDLIIGGRGRLVGAFGEMPFTRGAALFLPAGLAAYHYERLGDADLEIIRCLPPILEDGH